MIELILILFVFQLIMSCMINTYYSIIPNTWFDIVRLSFLPCSILNISEMKIDYNEDLIDNINW